MATKRTRKKLKLTEAEQGVADYKEHGKITVRPIKRAWIEKTEERGRGGRILEMLDDSVLVVGRDVWSQRSLEEIDTEMLEDMSFEVDINHPLLWRQNGYWEPIKNQQP